MVDGSPSDNAVLDLLSRAAGPAPWYMESFPEVEANGVRLVWHRDELRRGREYSVLLCPEDAPGHAVLAISMYSRVFSFAPNLLGIWFEDENGIQVCVLDPDQLTPFPLNEPLSNTAKHRDAFSCAANCLDQFCFSRDLEAGEHRIELPLLFAGVQTMLFIGEYAKTQEAACSAIFEIRPGVAPGSRRLGVYPQKWFTRDDYDLGYQWITRVAREPVSGRLVGDGIRIAPFVLKEDGEHIEKWITD